MSEIYAKNQDKDFVDAAKLLIYETKYKKVTTVTE